MPKAVARIKSKTNEEIGKPLDWGDLHRLGLESDHFYRLFNEVNRDHCPRCQNTWLNIGKKKYKNQLGWEWVCMGCAQRWREPKITPCFKADIMEDSENPMVTITRYK